MGRAKLRETNGQRDVRLRKISELHLKGYSVYEIAAEVGMCCQTINNDLKTIRQRYNEQMIVNRGELVSEQVQQYRLVMQEAWKAWSQSKLDKEKEQVTSTQVATFEQTKNQLTREGQTGNAQYLSVVVQCMRGIQDLLGLDAPKKAIVGTATLNWDQLLAGLDGAVDDEVEKSIAEALGITIPIQVEAIPQPEVRDGEQASE